MKEAKNKLPELIRAVEADDGPGGGCLPGGSRLNACRFTTPIPSTVIGRYKGLKIIW